MRQRLLLLPLLLAAFLPLARMDRSFRGPGGSGSERRKRGCPATWSSTENIAWRTKLPGPGTSSPICHWKRVYLTCYSGYGLEPGQGEMEQLLRHLVCIDRGTGAIVWTKDFKPSLPESKYGPGGNESQHGYSSSTPASDGKHLYVFFGKSGVYCLDLDGKEVWHASVGTGTHGWGSSNSPVLHKDLVIINACIESGSLVASTRTPARKSGGPRASARPGTRPVLVDVPRSGTELVVNESKAVIGFEPATGKELWRVNRLRRLRLPERRGRQGLVYAVRNEALASGPAAAATSPNRTSSGASRARPRLVPRLSRTAGSTGPAAPSWPWTPATGKEVFRGPPPRPCQLLRLAAGGRRQGVLRLPLRRTYVVADGPMFKLLAHNKFEDDDRRTNASPIASDGCLLLRTDRYLYCIGKKG